MKSKKFVLAALALLAAITMALLPLAGCKNDTVPETPEAKQEQAGGTEGNNDSTNTEDNTSGGGDSGTVPETPAAKLVSISVTTPPTRTVYSVGQSFDPTGMKVTATYDDGTTGTVTGTITTDTSTLTQSAGVKPVTVSYTEGETTKTNTFSVTVFPAEVEVLTDYESPNNTGNDCTYIAFGEWPQTEAVDFKPTTASQSHGIFDGNYYVEENDKYVEKNGKYYKVEPIVWRVLTTSYEAPEGGTVGEILLLAEKILTGGIPYYDVDKVDRTVDGATIHPNNYEHSAVRAWLNGLKYQYKMPDAFDQIERGDYFGKGFLQTAFTESAQKLIELTSVDNSAASTTDKIFLLSQQEATNSKYGFGADSTRIRDTTDYANATGAYQGDSSAGYGGWWWLRSPDFDDSNDAHVISIDGDASTGNHSSVDVSNGGVVPALSISLTGN